MKYQFTPAASSNPWIGYGIGVESTGLSGSSGGNTFSVSVAGWEFGHFMAGWDFRLNKTIGIGPMVDLSLGQYSTSSVTDNGQTMNGSISNQALHEWLLIGGRMVIFPVSRENAGSGDVMRIWTIVVLGALGACSSTSGSSATNDCCIIQSGDDAGATPSCFCGSVSSGSGVSIATTVTGSTCTVTVTYTVDGGSSVTTSQGTVPTSASECAMDLPIGG